MNGPQAECGVDAGYPAISLRLTCGTVAGACVVHVKAPLSFPYWRLRGTPGRMACIPEDCMSCIPQDAGCIPGRRDSEAPENQPKTISTPGQGIQTAKHPKGIHEKAFEQP